MKIIRDILLLSVGAGAGYYFAIRRLKHVYAVMLEAEIQKTKEFLEAVQEKKDSAEQDLKKARTVLAENARTENKLIDELINPTTGTAEDAARAMVNYQQITAEVPEKPKKPEIKPPYVISLDQFLSGVEQGYEANLLTYYQGDDILADVEDNIAPENTVERVIGRENLEKFGEMSSQDTIVYIRHEAIKQDFEVHRNPGSYAEIVGTGPGDDE